MAKSKHSQYHSIIYWLL